MTPEVIAQQYNLRRTGNRYTGPCPQCGGSARSDKFDLRDDGGFKCYACDFRGDAITWHRQMLGMSCPEAHEAIGKDCHKTDCAVYSTCRLGDGTGKRQRPQPQSVQPVSTAPSRTVRTADVKQPSEAWMQWAEQFFAKSQKTLADQPEVINYLKQRGVDPAACQLGWNDHTRRVNRKSIGLTPERNGKSTLWIPPGIVIPNFIDGRIYSLNIRRTDADLAKFLPDRRYQFIEGGTRAPMLLGEIEQPAGVVIVEAELDAIACHQALDAVAIVALATVQGNLTEQIQQICQHAPIILVALDADEERTDGKVGAGQKAVGNWRSTWRHARYWPVPSGKDPGDYVKAGGCLATWIKAGLPPRPESAEQPKSHDHASPPLVDTAGGEGCDIECFKGVSGQGQPYVVANKQADIAALYAAHRCPVFHAAELKKLKGVEKEAAEMALAAKDVFDNAEVIGVRLLEG